MIGNLLHLRSLVRRAVNGLGYDIIRYQEPLEHPLNVLRPIIAARLARDPNFFFVQVGANDGVRSDPLRPLILEYNLNGLFVEPLPDQFERLQKHYSGRHGLLFENAAVSATDGERDLYRVPLDAPVPDWVHGLASFHRDHLTSIPTVRPFVQAVRVPTLSMASLLARHQVREVSLLMVDVEGYDAEVVRLTFAAGCFPEIIYYEHCNLLPGERLECRKLMKKNGYRFTDIDRDTLAVREVH